jgi:hypothetical protein
MTKPHVIPFRADDKTHAAILEMARAEDRTVSKMVRILVIEALKDRQCRDAIRRADGREAQDVSVE